MITHLSIRNFAIIEDVSVDFDDGLNIITGETGAGKSIVIEAVSLALGARADTTYIRTGCDKATVQLVAELDGEEYIISRELSASGRNICRINAEIVPLSEVSSLCSKIADIHGQYDHQSLLDPSNHIRLIDNYREAEILPLKKEVSESYSEYSKISRELNDLISNEEERRRKKDFMAFELDEITKADLKSGEDEELAERISILENSEKIYENLEKSYMISSEDALSSLNGLLSSIESISSFSDTYKAFGEQISEYYYGLQDLTTEIRREKDSLTFSPEELNECISRLDVLENLKRKYGKDIEGLLSYADELAAEIGKAENSDAMKDKLQKDLEEAEKKLVSASEKLSSFRRETASVLEKRIIDELNSLNFAEARLSTVFRKTEYTASGIDDVEFLISTNRGEDLKPLAKVASGGEMSRIMLAIKAITAEYDDIPTMIFDEIDAGISGVTASVVARKLKAISHNRQIICITHLPQIAAAGKYNYMIEKSVKEDSTFTDIRKLDYSGKIEEIARLLGGDNITPTTLRSAKELIDSAS